MDRAGDQLRHHHGHHPLERGARCGPAAAGGERGRGTAAIGRTSLPGHPRRAGAHHPHRAARARRCGAAGSRRRRSGRLPAAGGPRPLRQPGPSHRRALPGRETCRRSAEPGGRGLRGRELPVHGHIRHQRHRHGGRVPDRTEDGARGACRRARHAAATGRIRARHPAVRAAHAAVHRVSRPVRAGRQCAVPPPVARTRCCLHWRSLSASRPSFCPWWSR